VLDTSSFDNNVLIVEGQGSGGGVPLRLHMEACPIGRVFSAALIRRMDGCE
jgi:hypothetical protein